MGLLFGGARASTSVPVTAAQVIAALKNITARNYFFSRKWAADGKENNALVTFSPTNRSATYSGSSSIAPSFSFSIGATPTLALPCLETYNQTFVAYNLAGSGASVTLAVDGTSASSAVTSLIGDGLAADQRAYKFTIPKSLRSIATVSPTFAKGTGEAFNEQAMHMIPGLWATQDSGGANETNGGANKTFTVAQNDLIFIAVSNATAAPTGTATSTLVMNRNTGTNEYIYAVDSAGDFTVNPATFFAGSFFYSHAFWCFQLRFSTA